MAFQHRLCVTTNASNRVPWRPPKDYVPDDFLHLLRSLQQNRNMSGFSLGSRLPGLPGWIDKYCTCCGISVDASDQPGLNRGWTSATWQRRQEMVADHTYFELGAYFFLANDPRVPESVRSRYSAFGRRHPSPVACGPGCCCAALSPREAADWPPHGARPLS